MKITYDFKEFCLGKMTPKTKRDAFLSKFQQILLEMNENYKKNQAIQIAVIFGQLGYDIVFIDRNENTRMKADVNGIKIKT